MGFHIKTGDAWREVSKTFAKVEDAWRTVTDVWGYMDGGWKTFLKNEIVYVNTADRTAANIHELMGSPTAAGTYVFENTATISAGTSDYALRTGVFPTGSTLIFINKGYVRGRGGKGGNGNTTGAAGVGQAGGTALYLDFPCTIVNEEGYLFGGGGGGGGYYGYTGAQIYTYAGGGGGAGSTPGAGGAGTAYNHYTAAQAGSLTSGGAGGNGTSNINGVDRGYGGNGGGLGAAGGVGSANSQKNSVVRHAGGAGGAAILSNGFPYSIVSGNNTTQLKGATV